MIQEQPHLSIVLPLYQSAGVIADTLSALLRHLDGDERPGEIIAVDDGSTDGTGSIVEAVSREDARVIPLRRPRNEGKGATVAAGVRVGTGRVLAFMDADLPYPLATLDALVERVDAGADLAIGARDLSPSGFAAYGPRRRVTSAVFRRLIELGFGLDIEDTQCGIKAFRASSARGLFQALMTRGFAFDVELLLLARHWGLRLERVPAAMRPMAGSSIRVARHSGEMLHELYRLRRRQRRGDLPPRPRGL